MSAETNLHTLLRTMTPELQEGEFVFCTIPEGEFGQRGLTPVGVFHEREGVTLILFRAEAEQRHIPYTYPARMITLTVHSSLEAVGFLAAITAKLAEAGISVNAVSAYYHDHLFVPVDRASDAMHILKTLAQQEHDDDI